MPIYASSEKTFEALLEAAGELAAENGFANVSTRAVAARAGANVSSIHYHFGSKDGLFEAVVRRILLERARATSIRDIVAELEGVLDTADGLSLALRRIVRGRVESIFDEERPRWQMRLIHQVMQHDSPLREMVFREFLDGDREAYFHILRRVRADMPLEEMVTHYNMIMAPIIFHSDYMAPILYSLGRESYDKEYLKRLEDMVVLQAQRALGLPSDTENMHAFF